MPASSAISFSLGVYCPFIRSSKVIDELCTTVTEYVKFCKDLFIVRKRVLSYPNTKPWVNKEIRSLLKDKQNAFKDKEREKLKQLIVK